MEPPPPLSEGRESFPQSPFPRLPGGHVPGFHVGHQDPQHHSGGRRRLRRLLPPPRAGRRLRQGLLQISPPPPRKLLFFHKPFPPSCWVCLDLNRSTVEQTLRPPTATPLQTKLRRKRLETEGGTEGKRRGCLAHCHFKALVHYFGITGSKDNAAPEHLQPSINIIS